jgi:hypothetical protein
VITSNNRFSRRTVFRGSAALAAALAAERLTARFSDPVAAKVGPPPNVRVSNDEFPIHGEPYLAANPRDRLNLLGACMVYPGTKRGLATYASFDGGMTWQSNGLLPGVEPDYDGDVTVAFDARGHGFVCGMVGNRQQPQQDSVRVWRTDDGGRTFQPPVTAASGLMDHPGLAIDRSTGASAANLYIAGTFFNAAKNGLAFVRSVDGGQSFEVPRFVDSQSGSEGRLPVVAAGPDGMLSVMYYVGQADGSNVVKVISSEDHGETFSDSVDLTQVGFAPSVGGVMARSGPAIAAAPDGSGVYAAAAGYDAATGRSAIQIFSSHDRGRTWGPPTTVASSTEVVYAQPQLTVDDEGRVGLSVFALAAKGRVDVLLFTSERRLARFGPPLTITTQAFDGTLGLNGGRDTWIGDYQGFASTPGVFHPFWNDTRTGHLEIFTATVVVDDGSAGPRASPVAG